MQIEIKYRPASTTFTEFEKKMKSDEIIGIDSTIDAGMKSSTHLSRKMERK